VEQKSRITGNLVVGTGYIFYSKKKALKLTKQEVVLVLIRKSQALQIDILLMRDLQFSRQAILKLQPDDA
jgi:hypothetical protein